MAQYNKLELEELIDCVVKDDRAAFAELVSRFKKKIYSIAFRMLGNHLDADEVAQETFVRVYERRRDLKSVSYVSSFIIRIATNYSIDLIRKRKKKFIPVDDLVFLPEVMTELAERISQPDQVLENANILETVKECIQLLPPKQKIAVIMHDLEGYSKAEIAAALDCPQATVRSNLHIARTKLRKWLSKRLK